MKPLQHPAVPEYHHGSHSKALATMTRLITFAAFGLTLLNSLSDAAPQPCLEGLCNFSRRDLSVQQVGNEIGPKLCRGSLVIGPDDPRFAQKTARYQAYEPPTIQVVVQPACEDDIPKIVNISLLHRGNTIADAYHRSNMQTPTASHSCPSTKLMV